MPTFSESRTSRPRFPFPAPRFWNSQTVVAHEFGYFRTLEETQELPRDVFLLRRFQDHSSLIDRWIERGRNFVVPSLTLQRRRCHQGERQDPDIRVAGLNKLRSLRDIFPQH